MTRLRLLLDVDLRVVTEDFTVNLTQKRVFIDRFYRINHTKTYNFHAPTLVASLLTKSRGKCAIL